MTDVLEIVLFFVLLIALAFPLGAYLFKVFEGKKNLLSPVVGPLERLVYRVTSVDSDSEMSTKGYIMSVLGISVFGIVVLTVLLMVQRFLPYNPAHAPNMGFAQALNVAVSFVTNTNWQSYAPEASSSNLVQMIGLAWQNFISAAVGIAVLVALVRGLTKSNRQKLGNFFVDLTRALLYVLIPLSLILSVVFVSQGVVQNLKGTQEIKTVDKQEQTLVEGPVASQEAIKLLGTNGGGYYNANSAHPFEDPTPLTGFLSAFAILLIPAALTIYFGRMAGNMKQGLALLGVMTFILAISVGVIYLSDSGTVPLLAKAGAGHAIAMEGKEQRFGIASSAIFTAATTSASCGAVNAMISSMTPLAGGMALLNIMLGEVVFGGVGSGLYGMLIFVFITIFIAGLMVGRTPEYLGKKIGPREMKLAMAAILALVAGILLVGEFATVVPAVKSTLSTSGPHGLTEMLYAAASSVGNNGSSFAGLSASSPFWLWSTTIGMLVGRFLVIVPVLGIAGSMGKKTTAPPSPGTFPTDSVLFAGLLFGIIVIVGALSFFPALALGPILEHLGMIAGHLF